jgi:hypothetical protein
MITWGATENSQRLLSNIENLTFSYATKNYSLKKELKIIA